MVLKELKGRDGAEGVKISPEKARLVRVNVEKAHNADSTQEA